MGGSAVAAFDRPGRHGNTDRCKNNGRPPVVCQVTFDASWIDAAHYPISAGNTVGGAPTQVRSLYLSMNESMKCLC